MAIKTHEVTIVARITKALVGDNMAAATCTVDAFVVDGVDIVEGDITGPHMAALVADVKLAVQDHTGEA